MKKNRWIIPGIVTGVVSLITVIVLCFGISMCRPQHWDYGFARSVPPDEEALRQSVVATAQQWLDCKESDGSHAPIVDLYNSHTPLAQGYEVQYDDDWCATFVSAVAIQLELTDIIPTECGCQRQIALFKDLSAWIEDDAYVPLPGDIIYYATKDDGQGDCQDWSDHVGIVVGTANDYIKVIEGNNADKVTYRYIKIDARTIRGYAAPNYSRS